MPSKDTDLSDTFEKSSIHVNKEIKNVAVIGGGASGAIALDSLLKENAFVNVTVFERRSKLGGIWVLDEDIRETPNSIVKAGRTSDQSDPQLENPLKKTQEYKDFLIIDKNTQERFVETPAYRELKTNIIEQFMTFSDVNQWIPDANEGDDNKYVDREVVTSYIDSYLKKNLTNDRARLSLNTTVEDVTRIRNIENEDYHYELTLRRPYNETQDLWWNEKYDAIVISTGHYHVPFIPDVPGLSEIQKSFPGVVEHAKFFRSSKPYKGKKVIVVGSRASGADLTKFISSQAEVVYQSIRNFNGLIKVSQNVRLQPTIKEIVILDEKNFKVIFENGEEVNNPDHLIYATGYQFSYPFLNRLFNSDSLEVTKNGVIVPHLYQHTFCIHEPLITFIGVPIDGISFRVFEYQAILVSRYLSGKISLPSREEQNSWIFNRVQEKKITRAYHTIGSEDALNFIGELVKLGETKHETKVGREFPKLTARDVETYKEAGAYLRKFWDEI